jgi:hypothetical protein
MPSAHDFVNRKCQTSVTIASGQTTSPEIDLAGTTLVGILFPTITSTTVKFQAASVSGGTYATLVDGAGNDISKTIASGKYLPLDPVNFRGVQFLKLIFGSSEGADRTLTLISAPI